MANWPTVSTPAVAAVAAPVAAPAPAPVPMPSASALMGLQAPPEAEAAPGPRMPDTTVDPFNDPSEEAKAPDGPAPGSIHANPARTAAQVCAHVVSLGADPAVAALYQGRMTKALAAPAPTAEERAAGISDAHQALLDQYGDRAPAIIEMAHEQARLLARDQPHLTEILRSTALGWDVHLIKSLASHNYKQRLHSLGYRID